MNKKVGDSKLMRLAACLVTAASLTANVASATELQFGPGNGSRFPIEEGVEAHVVGVYGLDGSHFVQRSDGFRAFTDSRVVDCEKGSGAAAYDHSRCWLYSDIDMLTWQGWLQYTPYADEDAYAYAYHLYCEEGDTTFKSFDAAASEAGKVINWDVVTIDASFANSLTEAFSKNDRFLELWLDFLNYNWYGSVGDINHAVVCCGYAVDTTKPLTDPTCLKGLFIIDPDNDRETNGGRAAAPDTITYCPVERGSNQYLIQGVFGATGHLYDGDTADYTDPPEEVTPRWSIAVAFNANGGSGSMAAQVFAPGTAQNLTENAFKRFGYAFAGWATSPNGPVVYRDEQSVTFSSSVTLYAVWSEVFAGKVDTSFAKAQTVVGALYTGNGLAGTTQVKFGKITNKRTVKISATASILMNGRAKKVMAKAATVDVDNPQAVLSFKAPIGDMTLTRGADGTFKLMNATYFMGAATVGGALGGQKTFSLKGFNLAVPGTLLEELLPYAETFSVAGTRWQFAKAASVKLVKNRATNTSDLVVDSSAGKTNLSGLRLTYTVKTGQFKGAFKAYGLSETNGKKKVTKYTVNVIGFVVNGRGSGEASCRRPAGGPWSVTVK